MIGNNTNHEQVGARLQRVPFCLIQLTQALHMVSVVTDQTT